MREKFLEQVTVLDTETTNLYADKAEIVEIAVAHYHNNEWRTQELLLGSHEPIPPEASAKNHISNRMIANLPKFKDQQPRIDGMLRFGDSRFFVAHNCKYDQQVLEKNYTDIGKDIHVEFAKDKKNWICTHRLAKHLLAHEFNDMQYNLSYLRYKLDLPIDDNLPAHRAGADTLVCATLFEFLVDYAIATDKVIDGLDLADQMHYLCWEPIIVTKWPFGKYKGKNLSEIDNDYFSWALSNLDVFNSSSENYNPDLLASIGREVESRQ